MGLVRVWLSFPLFSVFASSIEVNDSSINMESCGLGEVGWSLLGDFSIIFLQVLGAFIKPNIPTIWYYFYLLSLDQVGLNCVWLV